MTIPIIDFSQLGVQDILIIPCVKSERKKTLKFIETIEEVINKNLENKSTEEIHEQISKNKINKTIKLKGYVKENKFLGANEIIVKEILKN